MRNQTIFISFAKPTFADPFAHGRLFTCPTFTSFHSFKEILSAGRNKVFLYQDYF